MSLERNIDLGYDPNNKFYSELMKYEQHPEWFTYTKQNQVPKNMIKYWKQRDRIFSKFKSGNVFLTEELWFSVTPEKVAIFFAKMVKACFPDATTILDVFCGGGGNTIQLAKLFPRVIGVDNNLQHCYCTFKNSQRYDVSDRVFLKYDSWPSAWEDIDNVDVIFASPPWGGPSYSSSEVFNLEDLLPVPLEELLKSCFQLTSNVCLFLPRNSDVDQISAITRKLLGPKGKGRIVYVKNYGGLKGIGAFWGDGFMPKPTDVLSEADNADENSQPLDY